MVIGQLARRLGLPLRCSGNFTTSKLPDAQAMMEGTMSMLAAIHCGANFILHSAGFLDGLAEHVLREIHAGCGPVRQRCILIWMA